MYEHLPLEFSIAIDLVSRCTHEFNRVMLMNIRLAATANTLTILWSSKKEPIGFVAWAGVNKDSIYITRKFKQMPTRLWEYKEGHIAHILDVLFLPPFNQEAKYEFKKFVMSRRAIFFSKHEKNRLYIRTSSGFKAAAI